MMHNWYEVYLIGREQTADRLKQAEAQRRADRLRLGRSSFSLRATEGAAAKLILSRGELLTLRVRSRAWSVRCVAGCLWVTADGADHVLEPGDTATFGARGEVVVQALRISTLRLDCPSSVRVSWGASVPAAAAG